MPQQPAPPAAPGRGGGGTGTTTVDQPEFRPPPECPVFEPSWEEFSDPFAFINKIRPVAERTGICKVRPPPGWQPPFACDVDKLHFVPRIQRLNELEAQTRVKLNFLDQIAKFWDLQGCALKIPFVERKILDLYKLNKLVAEEGGFDLVCHERRWTRIALQMGFAPGKAIGSHLRAHYQKILYPYNLFQSGTTLLQGGVHKAEQHPGADVERSPDSKDFKPPGDPMTPQRPLVPPSPLSPPAPLSPNARRGKRIKAEAVGVKTENGEDCGESRPNLRRRMGSFVAKPEPPEKEIPVTVKQEPVESQIIEPVMEDKEKEKNNKSRYKKHIPPVTPLSPVVTLNVADSLNPGRLPVNKVDLVVCLACSSGADEDRLLLCDGCDDSYHTFCLLPPLHDVPKGDWRCPKCLAQECCKPQEAFGFEQAYRDYSLRAFGQMADAFKSDYFNMPVHMVPTELVEKEFWRLVGAIEEDVTVEYGADIASKEFGSGFPIRNGRFKVAPADEKYLSCGWNLNNMAMMEPSVLTHVTADICGMTLPWLYVGMCFSSFCWHIEDHWSYSINYLHWGEPKTWYGAPGFAAEQLEAVMRKLAPELFESQPDLLHQLVTIMNPNTLMSYGVPIYRTNQCAGEFVVTFPRAYHSGFNQGFNFAEAVNFCTVDWMPLGRQCVDHYRLLHRYNVFSHDEMVVNMASKAHALDVVVASAVHRDMEVMIRDEKVMRDKVKKMGVLQCKEARYDHLQDDERQCAKCRTTCYLSAVTCPCSPGVLVCLYHAEELCDCPLDRLTLNYRHTLDDLYPMMTAVKQRAELYDGWASRVTEALEARLDKKKGLATFRALLSESESKLFPDSDLLRRLRLVTQDGEKCSNVAQQLINGNTRYRCVTGKSHSQLTVEELRSFVRQLYNLPCSLPQAPLLKELLNSIEDFQQHSEKLLSDPEPPAVQDIQNLLDSSQGFDVELPELPGLRARLEQARWLDAVRTGVPGTSTSMGIPGSSPLGLEALRRLIDQGIGLAPHPSVDKAMAGLQELLTVSEHWEEKASALLRARPPHSIESLSAAAEKGASIPAQLPSIQLLKEAVKRGRDWLQEAEEIQAGACVPVLDVLSDLVLRGRSIQVHLEPLEPLEVLVRQVQQWKEETTSMFLMKESAFTLLEVLCPRCELGGVASSPRRKNKKNTPPAGGKKKACALSALRDLEKKLTHCKDTTSAMAMLEELSLGEMQALLALRASNESKLLPAADCAHLKVCTCHKAPMGAMLQCELCRDAFHSVCVRDPSSPSSPPGGAVEPWLCPLCRRCEKKKPSLAAARTQLAALQRLRARLPEGDALGHALHRALCWQRRATQQLDALEKQPGFAIGEAPPTLTRWASTTQSHAPTGQTTEDDNTQAPYLTPEWNRTQHAVFYTEHRCIPLQGLGSDLEELMIEGLLLPVWLPEVDLLYLTLLNNTPQSNTAPPQDDGHTTTQCSNSQGKSLARKEGGDGTDGAVGPKRPLEEEEGGGEQRSGGDRKLHHKRQRMNRKKKKNARPTSTSASPRSDFSPSDEDSDWSDGEAEVCPAQSCTRPQGDQVHWVQCDGSCNQWFHQACVGVTAELARSQDYICTGCKTTTPISH